MRACKEIISDQQVVDKILRTLPPQFHHVAIVIEESKDLYTMWIEELQHSLKDMRWGSMSEDPIKNRDFMHDPITKGMRNDHGKETSQTPPPRTRNKWQMKAVNPPKEKQHVKLLRNQTLTTTRSESSTKKRWNATIVKNLVIMQKNVCKEKVPRTN